MYSTETDISSSFHWFQLNSWSELQQYVLRNSNPKASLHLQKSHPELRSQVTLMELLWTVFPWFRLGSRVCNSFLSPNLCYVLKRHPFQDLYICQLLLAFKHNWQRKLCGRPCSPSSCWVTDSLSLHMSKLPFVKEMASDFVNADVICAEKEGDWLCNLLHRACIYEGGIFVSTTEIFLFPIPSEGEGLHFL